MKGFCCDITNFYLFLLSMATALFWRDPEFNINFHLKVSTFSFRYNFNSKLTSLMIFTKARYTQYFWCFGAY